MATVIVRAAVLSDRAENLLKLLLAHSLVFLRAFALIETANPIEMKSEKQEIL